MKKVYFLIIGVSLTAIVFSSENPGSSPIPVAQRKSSIRIVDKKESPDFLARRKSFSSSRDSSGSSPRYSSRSRFSPTDECPLGMIDGKIIPSQKLAENREQK